jgi:hypothetical protein
MRTVLTALLAAALMGLGATSLSAQGFYGYGGYTYGWGAQYGYNFTPACPIGYHYSCWVDAYGYKRCGCLLNDRW